MRPRTGIAALLTAVSAAGVLAATAAGSGSAALAASSDGNKVKPGELLVSGTIYQDPGIVAGQTQLQPGCTTGCATAIASGAYPDVFNNASVDGSFGITSKIFLDEITTDGRSHGRIMINPNAMVTSFSSKSELALNLSPDAKYVTFMGYVAAPGTVDVSNANTPGEIDPENAIATAYYRGVGQLDANGTISVTETNAYTGDNGRAAIAATVNGQEYLYAAGNASSVETPQLPGTIIGSGAQLITPSALPEADQNPGAPTPVGSFNVGAPLPTSPLSYDAATLQTNGLPSNMCILKGFPTALAKGATDASDYPFGMWFANDDTLYVADEGSGDNAFANGSYTAAAASTTAGLQKWVFNSGTGQWQLAYTLRSGLDLGQCRRPRARRS